MKLKIKDGRGELYQWDIGRKLIIEDGANIDYLQFADLSKDDGVSYKSEVIEENGIRCCRIPNACFANESTKLVVYAVDADDDGMATTTTVVFPIRKRQKPSDYTASPEIIISAEEILRKASAKADEAESYMNTSMQYAINPVDEVISGTDKYSSLHWASKANDIYNDVVEYVGSPSDPSSALGSIDTARQSAITEIDTARQSAITDIDAHVDTVKIDLTSYVENAESYSEEAASYASQALSYSTSASTSESNAKAAAEAAAAAESNSLSYKDLAETAKSNAQNARDEAVSAKNIAIETIVSIQGIESNVSSMKSSVDASEANVTTMQSDVSTMKASVETLKSETQTIVDNAENDVKGLLSTKADKTELAVERARIDSLSKLSEGSTTGDAELIDLRIGVDGVTYGNAGTAVRTQISELKGDLNKLATFGIDYLITKDSHFSNGYIDSSGAFVETSNTQMTSDFIELESGIRYVLEYNATLDTTEQTYPRTIVIYDANKNKTGVVNLPSDMNRIVLSDSEKYIRINYNASTVNILLLYKYGDEDVVKLKNDVVVPKCEKNATEILNIKSKITSVRTNYIHSRRAIICFILDGDYDLNESYEEIFSSHNIKIGFAPQYKTFYFLPTNQPILDKYLAWQKKGHEILAHLQYVMDDSTSYTDEQCKQFIKDSYTIMTGVNLNVVGAIGSGGKVADKFISIIKKYYDYGATENNHQADNVSYHMFETSNPYHLWRYSMQNSTLEQMKNAVDVAIENNALLMFYGHAHSTEINNFTSENLESLLSYIDTKVSSLECTVKTPKDAIYDFYSIRYDDLIH